MKFSLFRKPNYFRLLWKKNPFFTSFPPLQAALKKAQSENATEATNDNDVNGTDENSENITENDNNDNNDDVPADNCNEDGDCNDDQIDDQNDGQTEIEAAS